MVDFAKKLKEERLAEKLAKAVHKGGNPLPGFGGREEKPETIAEPIPDLREIDMPARERIRALRLTGQIAAINQELALLKADKKRLTEQLKLLCNDYSIFKATSEVGSISYYNAPRTAIVKDLLLQHKVSPRIIAACTTSKDSWTLRVTPPNQEGVSYEAEETD